MLVYGDTSEELCPRAALDAIEAAVELLNAPPRGLQWHGDAVALFIRLSGLTQGYADAEAAALGHDELTDGQTLLSDVLRRFALAIDRSWRSGFAAEPPIGLARWPEVRALPWPATVMVKRCEGYAYYALYPETYFEAARGLPRDSVVIGLRSIGTGLSALVAAAADVETVITVRPSGHPFTRSINAGPRLTERIKAAAHRPFVIVDEGPGLSGSSFGGTADWLEGLGVPRGNIIFMPSHAGDLGGEADPAHRLRWAQADKRVGDFDTLFTGSRAPMPFHHWFRDLTGPLTQALVELSGGQWASGRPDIPTSPSREARKYLLTAEAGQFVAKFAGIDDAARAKFDRARLLHAAGFTPEPLAMRYGFVLERFVSGTPTRDVPVTHLIEYLHFRHDRLPAPTHGASLVELLEMTTYNLAKIAPDAAAALASRWTPERAEALQSAVEPVHIDARLHWWEWLLADGRVVKTDAVDHSAAHDLVGCQDILWDVAGAIVELPDARANRQALADSFAETPTRRELLELMELSYLAFQLGWWSMSGTEMGAARSECYGRQLIEATTHPPSPRA